MFSLSVFFVLPFTQQIYDFVVYFANKIMIKCERYFQNIGKATQVDSENIGGVNSRSL